VNEHSIRLGKKAEALIEEQIEVSGWHHVGDSQFGAGGAPMIRGERDDQIRPDYSVMKRGKRVWIEVKGKTDWIPYEKVARHGIERENWEHYNRVADMSGDPCWLFIYEKSTGVVLCKDIADLPVADERIKESYPKDDPYGEDMVFFNKTDFRVKRIARAQYPEHFFGQDKLPLANVDKETNSPLFPGSDLAGDEKRIDSKLTDFATDGGESDD
jgi:hypothetical protein